MTFEMKVVDSTFSHNNAIGYAGERSGEGPICFDWDDSPGYADIKVWTDIRLAEAQDDSAKRKIALLLEPPAVNSGMYEWIVDNQHIFDVILTHQRFLVDRGHPFYFYPFGGSWIRDWGMFPKGEMISMLVSSKNLTEAHGLRHKAAKIPGIDVYGEGVGRYVESKSEALRDYRFTVVVENDTSNAWFTEKLIDPISQGTIPIYRGCSDIGEFFNPKGMILWQNIDELESIIEDLKIEDYDMRKEWAEENLMNAVLYKCPEDWIVKNHQGLLWQL